MSLRNPQQLLGRLQRAGVLCLPTGRTCINSGLPATPDTVLFSPLGVTGVAGTTCVGTGTFLECFNADGILFQNQGPVTVVVLVRAAIEHSIVQ